MRLNVHMYLLKNIKLYIIAYIDKTSKTYSESLYTV